MRASWHLKQAWFPIVISFWRTIEDGIGRFAVLPWDLKIAGPALGQENLLATSIENMLLLFNWAELNTWTLMVKASTGLAKVIAKLQLLVRYLNSTVFKEGRPTLCNGGM